VSRGLGDVYKRQGVYLTKSTININDVEISRYGITNVGYRPTIQKTPTLSIETNLFDFDSDIYGYEITTNFIKKIRSEIKFDSLSELSSQIQKDKIEAIKLLTEVHITSQKS
jgi:riboflavin kinase/FMN adenylyltransferase